MSAQTYPLLHPIKKSDGSTISEITLRRPKLKDVRAMNRARAEHTDEEMKDIEGVVAILISMTGLPDDVVDELDPDDLEAIGGKIDGFLSPSAPGQNGHRGARSRRK